jgi:uncharacterized circularly permuted ATP-grasp superfamily protein/uncharacterized alpha-E superfamily protein
VRQAYFSLVESSNPSLFAPQAAEDPCDLAAALAPAASSGHFDELRGRLSGTSSHAAADGKAGLSAAWSHFFGYLGEDGFYDLNQRTARLHRQIRDNGVTYNVYADADGPQRPWSLDLFPVLITPQDWAFIESGIMQRARLLDRVMADIYGPQQLLEQGLLPSALVHGHPGYLRGMRGVKPVGGTHLHIAAFDMARGQDGRWYVVSQRTQAPSGLGYLLENRLSISRQFPDAFRGMNVQPLAASYKALVDGLRAQSPALDGHGTPGGASRIVLLTPGPYNETYFEHAYLARFLGLSLVEGSDLLVRGERLFLKTLHGLEPVHGILKRLDDEFLDPLELRPDSTLGVPGLLQVIRAGNVLVVNAPGSAVLESSALLGFLPALSRHLLGETLALPSLATWWCGERAVLPQVIDQLANGVIKPTYPGTGMPPVFGRGLSPGQFADWSSRLRGHGDDYTVQAYLPLSQTPAWQAGKITPRPLMLRVFAVADGQGSWQVLAGGLARLAGKNEHMASMQQGGSSADVWVLGGVKAHHAASPAAQPSPPAQDEHRAPAWVNAPLRHRPPVTSRAAENLFWLGRYTERAENATRLARLILQSLGGEDQHSRPLQAWLQRMAIGHSMVPRPEAAAKAPSRRAFERALISGLSDTSRKTASVGFNLNAIENAASGVRERLSLEQWQVITRARTDFFHRCAGPEAFGSRHSPDQAVSRAITALESASGYLAAMTGAQTDRMTRDDGWRLLSVGRLIERLGTLADALSAGFDTGAVLEDGGFTAMLDLFDSTITFHAQYQQRRDIPAMVDLLVLDRDNPRSLAWVVGTLRERLAKLATHGAADLFDLTVSLPDPHRWTIEDFWGDPAQPARLFAGDGSGDAALQAAQLLDRFSDAAAELSTAVSRRYFSHAFEGSQSLGT